MVSTQFYPYRFRHSLGSIHLKQKKKKENSILVREKLNRFNSSAFLLLQDTNLSKVIKSQLIKSWLLDCLIWFLNILYET